MSDSATAERDDEMAEVHRLENGMAEDIRQLENETGSADEDGVDFDNLEDEPYAEAVENDDPIARAGTHHTRESNIDSPLLLVEILRDKTLLTGGAAHRKAEAKMRSLYDSNDTSDIDSNDGSAISNRVNEGSCAVMRFSKWSGQSGKKEWSVDDAVTALQYEFGLEGFTFDEDNDAIETDPDLIKLYDATAAVVYDYFFPNGAPRGNMTKSEARFVRQVESNLKDAAMAYYVGNFAERRNHRTHYLALVPPHHQTLALRFVDSFGRISDSARGFLGTIGKGHLLDIAGRSGGTADREAQQTRQDPPRETPGQP
ncbi:hypothetical protein QQZ08_002396 [Neonectria magnoliae]|uniref:Uncharacterized protein n=1 Tax=Neonectria magnoliae TaxID=2732573 RepID=A0ABR1IBY6_9HYPO